MILTLYMTVQMNILIVLIIIMTVPVNVVVI